MSKSWKLSRRTLLRALGSRGQPSMPGSHATLECQSHGRSEASTKGCLCLFPNGVAKGTWEPEKWGGMVDSNV